MTVWVTSVPWAGPDGRSSAQCCITLGMSRHLESVLATPDRSHPLTLSVTHSSDSSVRISQSLQICRIFAIVTWLNITGDTCGGWQAVAVRDLNPLNTAGNVPSEWGYSGSHSTTRTPTVISKGRQFKWTGWQPPHRPPDPSSLSLWKFPTVILPLTNFGGKFSLVGPTVYFRYIIRWSDDLNFTKTSSYFL